MVRVKARVGARVRVTARLYDFPGCIMKPQ
jgi:hypothetical protein